MTARKSQTVRNIEPDPFADAVFIDNQGVAGDLSEVLDAVREYDSSTIYGVLHRMPAIGVGPWEYVERIPTPIDMGQVMALLKDSWPAGGKYRLAIFAGGKTRKQIEFAIAPDPKHTAAPGGMFGKPGVSGAPDMMQMFMLQAQTAREEARQSREEQREYDRRREEARERASDRQMTMISAAVAALSPALIPMLTGANREKLSDIVALMNSGKDKGSNLKETVEIMALMKGLFDDKGGGFDPTDLMGSLARLAGPAAAAIGRGVQGMRGGPQGGVEDQDPGAGELHLAPPAAQAALAAPITASPPASTGVPVLDLIRGDVAYFFARRDRVDPDLAAETICDILDGDDVSEAEVDGVVAAFSGSDDWTPAINALAGYGIDLRADPQWAGDFLSALAERWGQRDRNGEPVAGGAGGMADPGDHAAAGAGGLLLNEDQEPGAGADQP